MNFIEFVEIAGVAMVTAFGVGAVLGFLFALWLFNELPTLKK